MNFFRAQDQAQASTLYLLLLLGVGLTLFAMAVGWLVSLVLYYVHTGLWVLISPDRDLLWNSVISVLLVVMIVSLIQYFLLRDGGHSVAHSLGGSLLLPSHPQYHEITTIVEEIALASGIDAPSIYLLPESGINAFAAGFNPKNAIIGITQGALEHLDRHELQGVIAHEFSHILHGDMRLNLHLTGLISGMLIIGTLGRMLLDTITWTRSTRSRQESGGNLILALYLLAIGLILLGWIGTLIGEAIKALISQQREYLADASAVRYTRYPAGIANALKKIGSTHSTLRSRARSTYAHLFFADAVSDFWDRLFDTHPPLQERIRRIDPQWDGTYPDPSTLIPQSTYHSSPSPDILSCIGIKSTKSRTTSTPHMSSSAPINVENLTLDPIGAQWNVFALLIGSTDKPTSAQRNALAHRWRHTHERALLIASLNYPQRLELLEYSINVLKMMSKPQYTTFRATLDALTQHDTSLWAWLVRAIIVTPLDDTFGLYWRKGVCDDLPKSLSVVFSFLIALQEYSDESMRTRLWQESAQSFGLGPMLLSISLSELDEALHSLAHAKLVVRESVLEHAYTIIHSDGVITYEERALLAAFSSLLRLHR